MVVVFTTMGQEVILEPVDFDESLTPRWRVYLDGQELTKGRNTEADLTAAVGLVRWQLANEHGDVSEAETWLDFIETVYVDREDES